MRSLRRHLPTVDPSTSEMRHPISVHLITEKLDQLENVLPIKFRSLVVDKKIIWFCSDSGSLNHSTRVLQLTAWLIKFSSYQKE